MTYMSTVNDFRRRLRIRLVDVEEHDSKKNLMHANRKRRGSLTNRGSMIDKIAVAPDTSMKKPWLVEASGTLFDSPSSLRAVREAGTKYYIAVAQDLAEKIMEEGYKVQTRCSIPLSATPQE